MIKLLSRLNIQIAPHVYFLWQGFSYRYSFYNCSALFCWASLLPPRLDGMANDGEYRMQATEHDITFLYSVGLCLRFGLRPEPRCELVRKSNMNQCSSSHPIARASMTMQEQNYRIVLPPARGPMVSMCHLKCVGPYGVHVSPKMCGPLWCPCVT